MDCVIRLRYEPTKEKNNKTRSNKNRECNAFGANFFSLFMFSFAFKWWNCVTYLLPKLLPLVSFRFVFSFSCAYALREFGLTCGVQTCQMLSLSIINSIKIICFVYCLLFCVFFYRIWPESRTMQKVVFFRCDVFIFLRFKQFSFCSLFERWIETIYKRSEQRANRIICLRLHNRIERVCIPLTFYDCIFPRSLLRSHSLIWLLLKFCRWRTFILTWNNKCFFFCFQFAFSLFALVHVWMGQTFIPFECDDCLICFSPTNNY